MKQIRLVAIIICALVILTSCAVEYDFAQNERDYDNFRLEIVNLECEMGDWAGIEYDEEQVTVISVISDEEKEAFITEFKEIKSYQPNFGGRIDSVGGKAIRLVYSDGEIELITHYGTAVVTDGEIWVHTTTFDKEPFDALLAKYS